MRSSGRAPLVPPPASRSSSSTSTLRSAPAASMSFHRAVTCIVLHPPARLAGISTVPGRQPSAGQCRCRAALGAIAGFRWLPQVWGKRSSCNGGRTLTTSHIVALIRVQGDHNNVVYGSLYRMDLASYSRHDPLKTSAGARPRFGYAYASRCFCVPSPPSYQQASLSRVACMHALCNAGVQPCANRTHLPCR